MEPTESISGLDLVVCACGEQEYTARDAIDAAIFRGELDVKWKEFLHQVAAERRADELELEADESAISSAAEAFRYEYDLITAEETEAWLANRGLTLDDFADYLTREYYASTLKEEIIPDEIEYPSAAAELRQSFLAELILSGEVATEGRYRYRRVDFLLEDLPVDAQHRFLSVSAGEVLKPLAHGDGFELCRILKKIEPQPDDPNVKSRIDQRLLDRHFAELTGKYTHRRLGAVSTPAAQ